MIELTNKYMKLCNMLAEYTKENIAVAFSGGVDSSLLLLLAVNEANKNKTEVYAYIAATTLHPKIETERAKELALKLGAKVKVISIDELKLAGIENNPVDRCYKCKKYMFGQIKKEAGSMPVLEGTNEDDLHEYRPGIKALKELGVISPLAKCNLTKKEIRKLALDYDIESCDKPSTPCMATRFAYNSRLTGKKLEDVWKIEEYIRSLGFYNVRCRVAGSLVRIEVDKADINKLIANSDDVTEYIKGFGFTYVTVDLEGFRRGSMDINIKKNLQTANRKFVK